MYPGLALTRSIGDTVGTAAGITSVPEVFSLQVQDDWRFVLICSDGVWEYLSSQEAVDIVGRFSPSQARGASDALATAAWNRWIQKEGDLVDDITVIVAWLGED